MLFQEGHAYIMSYKQKMRISFEIRIERPQQFGYDDDEVGTGVLAIADRFKTLQQVLAACTALVP